MKIKQTIKGLILGTIGIASLSLAVVSPVYVAADCAGVSTSIINCGQGGSKQCPDGSTPNDKGVCPDGTNASDVNNSGVWGLLLMVINILTAGVGIAAVGGIIYGSIMYTTAEGSADKVSKARAIITNVVIGLLAYALMFSLLNFIIPGGLFKQ